MNSKALLISFNHDRKRIISFSSFWHTFLISNQDRMIFLKSSSLDNLKLRSRRNVSSLNFYKFPLSTLSLTTLTSPYLNNQSKLKRAINKSFKNSSSPIFGYQEMASCRVPCHYRNEMHIKLSCTCISKHFRCYFSTHIHALHLSNNDVSSMWKKGEVFTQERISEIEKVVCYLQKEWIDRYTNQRKYRDFGIDLRKKFYFLWDPEEDKLRCDKRSLLNFNHRVKNLEKIKSYHSLDLNKKIHSLLEYKRRLTTKMVRSSREKKKLYREKIKILFLRILTLKTLSK